MVQSANDVATQIAEYVGQGSVQNFVDMMNQRAQELGCQNTHFTNASGMPDENHYTTAHDMALIFQEAIKNDMFREIIKQQNVVVGPTNMNGETRTFSCHHALVAQSAPEYYEGCFGGKTGVTEVARNTLVSGVTRDGMTLIAVTLRAEVEQIYQDQIRLFNYGFENFQKVEVPGGYVTIPKDKSVENLSIQEIPEETGTIQKYFYNEDYYLGSGIKEEIQEEIVLQPEEPVITSEPEENQSEKNQEVSLDNQKALYKNIICILMGVIGFSVIIAIVSGVKKRKRRNRKGKK